MEKKEKARERRVQKKNTIHVWNEKECDKKSTNEKVKKDETEKTRQ